MQKAWPLPFELLVFLLEDFDTLVRTGKLSPQLLNPQW
jgi:hypothetical protein